MTASELRRALADIPDDVPVMVYVTKELSRAMYEDVGTAVEKFAMPGGKVLGFIITAKK